MPSRGAPPVHSVPNDVLLIVFCLLLELAEDQRLVVRALTLVCRRWHRLLQQPHFWEHYVKLCLPSYPLIHRLAMNVPPKLPIAASLARPGVIYPSRESVATAFQNLVSYRSNKEYIKYLRQKRTLVLHVFVSFALTSAFGFFVAAMCTAEAFSPVGFCNTTVTFSFLWATYAIVFVGVVTNLLMTVHFEPLPLVSRIRRHFYLVAVSVVFLITALWTFALPTCLIQLNVSREADERFSWFYCAIPLMVTTVGWQIQVIILTRREILQWLRRPHCSLAWFFHFQAHCMPLLLLIAVYCVTQYVESQAYLFLFIANFPLLIALPSLAIIFLVDFILNLRLAEGITALCLCAASWFPICLVTMPVRGLSLVPLVLALGGLTVSRVADTLHKAHILKQNVFA